MANAGAVINILLTSNVQAVKQIESALTGVTKNANQVAQKINTSVVPSLDKMLGSVKGVGKITNIELVGAFEKLDKKTKNAIGTAERYKVTIEGLNKKLKEVSFTANFGPEKLIRGGAGGGSRKARELTGVGPLSVKDVAPVVKKDIFAEIDVGKLAARAALTIPVWLALRSGIMSVIDIVPTAVNRFKELDTAVSKMKILTDGADKIANFSEVAMNSLNKLSRESGLAVPDLQAVYTAVSSTGIDATTSLSAMETISKGALATGADAGLLASTMAGLVNTMGDTLDVGTTKADKFKALMSILHTSMKTNAGSMNDFAEALGQAGSTASVSGMSITELVANVAVLQTAMVKAGMGGTALRTALDQIVQKRQQVSDLLGGITKDQDKNQFTLVLAVVDKLKKFADSGDLVNANKYMTEIFGVKAGKNINVLRNNLEKFQFTLGDINRLMEIGRTQGPEAMMAQVAKDYEERLKTLAQQQERFKNITAELSSSLVAGFFGGTGNSWTDKLEATNDAMDKMNDTVKLLGETLKNAGVAGLIVGLASAFGTLQTVALPALLAFVSNPAFLAFTSAMVALSAIQAAANIAEGKSKSLNQSVMLEKFAAGGKARKGFADSLASADPSSYKWLKQRHSLVGDKRSLEVYAKEAMGNTEFFKTWATSAGAVNLDKIAINKTMPSAGSGEKQETPQDRKDRLALQIAQLDTLKRYGVDAIQLKERERDLVLAVATGEEKTTKQLEYQIAIMKLRNEEQQKYYDSLQSSIKDSLLGNLQGKGNNLFSDMSANFTSQLQESMATNLSSVIMSSGIGDVFAGATGFLDEGARRITDPVVKAHDEGGKKVHDYIVAAWDKITGKQTAASGAGMGTAGFSGGGNGLPGIWGSSAFTTQPSMVTSGPGRTSQGINVPSTSSPMGGGKPNFWGKAGAYGSIGAGTAITAAGGFQQMRGGGAKNFVGGAGQAGMAIGAGASGLLAMGAFGGVGAAATAGTAATGSFVAGSAASMLGVLGVVGLAIGAVLIIASMFMKGAKSTQTSTQTSETKVGSKISLTNQKLDLVNRNLIALRNSFETYALSSSSYFSEKSGNLDSQFALSSRRSFA